MTDDFGTQIAFVNVTIENDWVTNRNATITITVYNFDPTYQWFGFGISNDMSMVSAFEPRHEKSCCLGIQQGLTQTRLNNHRRRLRFKNFGFSK